MRDPVKRGSNWGIWKRVVEIPLGLKEKGSRRKMKRLESQKDFWGRDPPHNRVSKGIG